MNAGWGIGAFVSTFFAARIIGKVGWRVIIPVSMLVLAGAFFGVPFSVGIAMAAGLYLVAGTARGVGGIALSSSIMEAVPKHFMGRVSTLFSIASIVLQVLLAPLVGRVAQNTGLTVALLIISSLYLVAAMSGWLSGRTTGVLTERSEVEVTVDS
jgi:hypothetical protein